MAINQDDRTEGQKNTHTWLVIGTDRFMSGWGEASNGLSYAAWACEPKYRDQVLDWVESRSDMKRVREVYEGQGNKKYYAPGAAHCHIYVVTDEHPAIRHIIAGNEHGVTA
jgi:hypothetical protein